MLPAESNVNNRMVPEKTTHAVGDNQMSPEVKITPHIHRAWNHIVLAAWAAQIYGIADGRDRSGADRCSVIQIAGTDVGQISDDSVVLPFVWKFPELVRKKHY